MFIAYLTLLSALSISGVAIFYSVIGLATIFPGAFWPVVIMGSVLEVGKLITASWLYRHWKQTRFLLKTYLTIAVVVLSLITSMGIFGFLSKAHLEQNLAEDTVTQRIEIINNKIKSQETYIDRQTVIIERAEKSLATTGKSNKDAISIEQQSLKDVQDKFKTLLAVETNTVKDLNNRIKSLDADVTAILTQQNKAFFNEEKAAADLKASQKEERADINNRISEAQDRIAILKDEYAKDTAVIQSRIDKLREGDTDDKSDVYAQIKEAEANILSAQNNIDDLVVEREPLESKMIKLEAEVGPVKYIAALAVDWGVTSEVNTSEAVRWVILIIICVFDPLAVLLLIAANQSLLSRFPVKPLPPEEVLDLEKPDHDLTFDPKWTDLMASKQKEKMEKATAQLKDWQDKLEAFNQKVPQPEEKPVEIIQETKEDPNDSDWGDGVVIPEKKTKDKEIVADNMTDGFDPDEVAGYEEFNSKYEQLKVDKEKQIEEFKKREKQEQEALEEYSRKAREDDEEKSISEQIEQAMEPERVKPDFTEVIEPERAVTGMIGQRIVDKKGKVIQPTKEASEITDFERTGMLNKFHQEHGKFEDISDEELKKERDESNKAQFLADVSLSKEEAETHPPITESRMRYFQDIIDDILRGNTTYENVPEELKKTVAQIMDDNLPNPQIITKGSALKEQRDEGVEEMSAEGLKEKFMIEPKTEDRPMTDEELDKLLEGWDEENKPAGKTRMIIKDGQKVFVPVEDYTQNEEQDETTLWNKTKELDLPEPEKNELEIPTLENTTDEIPEVADGIKIENVIPKETFTKYKKRVTTDENYRQQIENRINDLITKIENGEVKLNDLTDEDQKVILEILNQEE